METNPNAEEMDELINQIEESLAKMASTSKAPPWVAKLLKIRDALEVVSEGLIELKVAMVAEALEDGFENMNEEQALYYNAVHSDLFDGLFLGWGSKIRELSAKIKVGLSIHEAGEELEVFLVDLDSYLSKPHVAALSNNAWTEDFLAPLHSTISEIRAVI